MRPVTMEEKIYRVLGVRQYRKFLVWVKLRYDQWRGKQDTDNYFLRGSSIEDMRFLKSQLLKNAKIHSFGALICLLCAVAAGRLWMTGLALLIGLHNLYCVLVQRMNLIRLNRLLKSKEKTRGIHL